MNHPDSSACGEMLAEPGIGSARPGRGYLMEVTTSRFGTVHVPLGEAICFPSGLIGFEDCQSWVLLADRPNDAVIWLQSTQVPEIALPVVDPRTFVPEFILQVEQTDWTPLGKREEDSLQVLVSVSRHDDSLRVNLRSPLVINLQRRLGRQVINAEAWTTDHLVWESTDAMKKTA